MPYTVVLGKPDKQTKSGQESHPRYLAELDTHDQAVWGIHHSADCRLQLTPRLLSSPVASDSKVTFKRGNDARWGLSSQ